METDETSNEEVVPQGRLLNELSNVDRQSVVAMLHGLVENGHLPRGSITKVAKSFFISRQSVTRIWGRAARAELPPNFSLNEELVRSQNSRKNCGRNKIWNIQDIQEHIQEIPHKKRRSMRDLASNLQIPLVQVHRLVHHPEKGIVPHTSALKPMLTEENKLKEVDLAVVDLEWCRWFIVGIL